MKKTLKTLLASLQEKNDGTLNGGFASIKGGFSLSAVALNSLTTCNNSGTCSSTNTFNCVNSGDCRTSTNDASSHGGCSNTGACFI